MWRQHAHLASDAGCCLLPLSSGLLSLHGSQGAVFLSHGRGAHALPVTWAPGRFLLAGEHRESWLEGDAGWNVAAAEASAHPVGAPGRVALVPTWRLGAEPLCVPTRQSLARRQPWREFRLGEVSPWGWGQWLVGMQLRAHLPSSWLGPLVLKRRSAPQALGELCASRRRKGSVLFNAAEGQVGCGQGTNCPLSQRRVGPGS